MKPACSECAGTGWYDQNAGAHGEACWHCGGTGQMKKLKTRGRKPMKGKLVCIKLDQQAIRDSKTLGKAWGSQTPETIRRSLRIAAERQQDALAQAADANR